jgi:hypothetical protein
VSLSEKAVEVDRALIFRVQDGLLRECWAFDQDKRPLDGLIGSDEIADKSLV